MSSGLVPTQTMLLSSVADDIVSAPDLSPKPATKWVGRFRVRPYRSTTVTYCTSCATSGWTMPSRTVSTTGREGVGADQVVGAEANQPCGAEPHLGDDLQILRQKMREGGFTPTHEHAVAQLFEHFGGGIAFVVQGDARRQIAVEIDAPGH